MKTMFFIVTISVLFLATSLHEGFSVKLDKIYVNENCGISIQYPKNWKAETDDFFTEGLKGVANIYPDPDDTSSSEVDINMWDISDYREKTIDYVSEIFRPEEELETNVIQDNIMQIAGFPAQQLLYIQGNLGEYEYNEDKDRIMEINILAYDRVYQISLEAENEKKFNKYEPVFAEMVNSLKIEEPTFEGINC